MIQFLSLVAANNFKPLRIFIKMQLSEKFVIWQLAELFGDLKWFFVCLPNMAEECMFNLFKLSI